MPLGYDVPSARQRRAARPPLGGGCQRRRLGERNCRAISLPPSALRAATFLAEGGKGKRIPTPVCALARNDRGTGWTGSSAPTMRDVEDAVPYGRVHKGMRIPTPVRTLARNDRGTGRTGSPAPTERNKSRAETGRRGRRPLRNDRGTRRTGSFAPTMCNRAPQWTKVSAAQLRTLLYISAGG